MAEQKKTIRVTLDTKQIIFDVQNKTYLTGQARQAAGMNHKEASYMQASDDDEHSAQVFRSVSDAIDQLKVKVGEYLVSSNTTPDNYISEAVEGGQNVHLALSMPSNYNEAAAASIASSMHDYVVNEAVAAWFTITNKADAADYIALRDQAEVRLELALYKRSRPTRPAKPNANTASGGAHSGGTTVDPTDRVI